MPAFVCDGRRPHQRPSSGRGTLDFANQFTGEPIIRDSRMTELSGGQTRALLIADATIICDTPIVLLDEVENAGIHRTRALELLRQHRKIFIFVTHDPRIALLSDYRIIMAQGRIVDIVHTDDEERGCATCVGRARRAAGALARQAAQRRPHRVDRHAGVAMKILICAGPATSGKSSVLGHVISASAARRRSPGVSQDRCPVRARGRDLRRRLRHSHAKNLLGGTVSRIIATSWFWATPLRWAGAAKCDVLIVETAGLCLRCSPYVDGGLGMVVLEATSGMDLPRKIGPMLSLADVAVVTKIDRVSQAEREVFRARIRAAAPEVRIREVNALYGIGIDPLVELVMATPDAAMPMSLRGNPPVGTCTICVGKKEIGWEKHFGVVWPLENQVFYRGE